MYLKSKPHDICLQKPKTIKHFRYTCQYFLISVYTQRNLPCPIAGMTGFATRLLGKERLSKIEEIAYFSHEQINIVSNNQSTCQGQLLVCMYILCLHGFKLSLLMIEITLFTTFDSF